MKTKSPNVRRPATVWMVALLGWVIASTTIHAAAIRVISGFTLTVLPANDDGSTSEIDIRTAFPDGLEFFGMRFSDGQSVFGDTLDLTGMKASARL